MEKKRCFGTVNAFIKAPGEVEVYGAPVANVEFFRGLLEYGTFDEYHIYLRDEVFAEGVKSARKLYGRNRSYGKMRLFPFRQLPANVDIYDYTVLHHENPALVDYHYIRSITERLIPISCVVHSASSHLVSLYLLLALLSPTRSCDAIFCSSRALLESLQKHFSCLRERAGTGRVMESSFYEVPFGIDLRRFRVRNRERMRRKLALPESAFIAGYVGRLTAENKMDLIPFLQVIKRLLDETAGRNIHFVAVGREQQRGYLSLLRKEAGRLGISRKVTFVTGHANADIPFYYNAFDVFVSPCDNVQETFGLTILEAMASGIPVVASDWDGYRDTILHGETGYLIPTYWSEAALPISQAYHLEGMLGTYLRLGQSVAVDISRYAGALRLLMENRDLRCAMGRKARAVMEAGYGWERVIGRYEAIWEECSKKAKEECRPVDEPFILNPPHYEIFSHYPSEILTPGHVLCITGEGARAVEKGELPVSFRLSGHLSGDLVNKLLSLSGKPIVLEELLILAEETQQNKKKHEIMLHLLWALKNNLLSVIFPAAPELM